jgi:aminoglycoside phosphotransferase family enzyme/predicted kinase
MKKPKAKSEQLISALQNPGLYEHPVERFSLIETHISWVVLTGSFAYKIKKPVNLGFVDFSTLEKRHFYCNEELRLNRRFSTDLYLDVVAISGSHKQPCLGKKDDIIEYAVKMREFPQQNLLDTYASEHKLLPAHIDSLAEIIVDFHRVAQPAKSDSLYGSTGTVRQWTEENFEKIGNSLPVKSLPKDFSRLKKWCLSPSNQRLTNMIKRQADGFVRECHGDLHLGNIAIIDGRITPFDCIEFNPILRWIDTTSEIAFVAMDLCAHAYSKYAWQFINRYFLLSGDYAGIALLRYYFVYRAMVRAKVEALRIPPEAFNKNSDNNLFVKVKRYLDLAQVWIDIYRPAIIIMHGLSGSGKSTLANHLACSLGAIQIRSDVERKRMFNLKPGDDSSSTLEQSIYTKDATRQTYDQLEGLSVEITRAGFSVIVDASFLKLSQREQFKELALRQALPFVVCSCEAMESDLRERINKRLESHSDASEANPDVLQHQIQTQEIITTSERNQMKIITTTNSKFSSLQLQSLSSHIMAS